MVGAVDDGVDGVRTDGDGHAAQLVALRLGSRQLFSCCFFEFSALGFELGLGGFGAAFDSANFETYCVELTQSFYLPSGDMTGYVLMPGASYAEWLHPATANRIGQLITYVNAHPGAVDNAAESTSLQLAIWNSIYDTDNTLAGGSFGAFVLASSPSVICSGAVSKAFTLPR